MKKTIEIDVPEGHEMDIHNAYGGTSQIQRISITFKKKEPRTKVLREVLDKQIKRGMYYENDIGDLVLWATHDVDCQEDSDVKAVWEVVDATDV